MSDVTMGLLMLAFFLVGVGYVTWCARIIGPDPDVPDDDAGLPRDTGATETPR